MPFTKINNPQPEPEQGWVVTVALSAPSLHDNTADADRLCRALQHRLNSAWVQMDLSLARRLPQLLRTNAYAVSCVVVQDRERAWILDVQPVHSERIPLGLAVDLGTTRMALRLVDLVLRRVLAETTCDNPQAAIGPDILTRIHHAAVAQGATELQQSVIDRINEQAQKLCHLQGRSIADLYLLCVAGNTTMSHLLTGLPVQGIIREPYIPAMNRFGLIRAAELGFTAHESARVMIFPCVGSYLGGDIIAGIMFADFEQLSEPALLVDVGTNAEVVLGNREWLIACAGAAGPALEGGVSPIGATAGPGVIDRVCIDPRTRAFEIHTIDELPATGICGSGFIDLAAGLFCAGMIDIRGKFRVDRCNGRLAEKNGIPHLLIVPAAESADGRDLSIGQTDMDSLIRSKAAMFTILETITMTMGMPLSQVETFFVAGSFGSLINPRSAITIGMLPDLPLSRFHTLGNSSLGGATMALLARDHWNNCDRIRDNITYLELNVNQDFMNRFSAARFLPHTDPDRFPSVRLLDKQNQ